MHVRLSLAILASAPAFWVQEWSGHREKRKQREGPKTHLATWQLFPGLPFFRILGPLRSPPRRPERGRARKERLCPKHQSDWGWGCCTMSCPGPADLLSPTVCCLLVLYLVLLRRDDAVTFYYLFPEESSLPGFLVLTLMFWFPLRRDTVWIPPTSP